MLAAYLEGGESWVGDKDPRGIEYSPLLQAVSPRSRVVHIFRDPRDVLASKKKADWSKTGYVWKHVFANRVQFRMGRTFGPKSLGGRYHEVCYEELLATPERVLAALCDELGIVFDRQMLSFGEAASKLVSEEELSWKKETLGPLRRMNRGKWKAALRPREVKLSELCCREAMVRGEYEPDKRQHTFSLWDRLWIGAGWLLIVLATRPYIMYQDSRVRRACRRIR